MICNVSQTDRWIRLFVGGLLIAWAAAGGPFWAWLGLVLLGTGAWRVCPVFALLGIGTYNPGSSAPTSQNSAPGKDLASPSQGAEASALDQGQDQN
ncbi:MAG TPA: DUF2892 domain-containing protein [Pseudobdellovibrionaceae bacterium]|nr:DUF2892 domain-containing protein [Pseudobdellovibrionaceae bacterium]